MHVNEEGKAISIPHASFGGIWTEQTFHPETFQNFIEHCLLKLKSLGVVELLIKQAPRPYCSQSEEIMYLLFKLGFVVRDLSNHHILEGRKKLKKSFKDGFPKYQSKAKQANLKMTCGNIQSLNFLQEMFDLNRATLQSLPVDESQLIRWISAFPERHFVNSVFVEGKPSGHALTVKVTSNGLFSMMMSYNPKNKHKLTGDLLMMNQIKLAVEQKVDFLDFGTSDSGGMPLHGLAFFKSKFSNVTHNQVDLSIQL